MNQEENLTVSEYIELLKKEDIPELKFGRNKLLDWLKKEGYFITVSNGKGIPVRKYINDGFFTLKKKKVTITKDGQDLIRENLIKHLKEEYQ